jgi:hypothetical protein
VHFVCQGTERIAATAFVLAPNGDFNEERVVQPPATCLGQAYVNAPSITVRDAQPGIYEVGIQAQSPSGLTVTVSNPTVTLDSIGTSSAFGPFSGSGPGNLQVAHAFAFRDALINAGNG